MLRFHGLPPLPSLRQNTHSAYTPPTPCDVVLNIVKYLQLPLGVQLAFTSELSTVRPKCGGRITRGSFDTRRSHLGWSKGFSPEAAWRGRSFRPAAAWREQGPFRPLEQQSAKWPLGPGLIQRF